MNASGEDFVDANLVLSTATPSVGGTPPPLPTARVEWKSYSRVMPSYGFGGSHVRNEMAPQMQMQQNVWAPQSDNINALNDDKPQDIPTPVMEVLTSTASTDNESTNSTFTIPRPATIPSDNTPHKVTVALITLPSKFSYTAIPKLTNLVYLRANLKNTSEFSLLPGPAMIFFDNNFVSTSELKQVAVSEDFVVFLGVDNGVKSEIKPIKKMVENASGFFSTKNSSQAVSKTMIIKNNKKIDIDIKVFEQLPLSSDSKIIVKLVEPDLKKVTDVKLTPSNNLEWRFTLPASEKRVIEMSYTIEWPKGREIQLDLGVGNTIDIK